MHSYICRKKEEKKKAHVKSHFAQGQPVSCRNEMNNFSNMGEIKSDLANYLFVVKHPNQKHYKTDTKQALSVSDQSITG